MSEKKLTLYRRKHIGYVFQMYNLIPNLTVRENIEVGAYLSDNPLDIDELMNTLGISYNADASFSGGNKTTNFYIGANYNHKEGVIKTNRLDKFNLKAKVQHDFTKWLEVGANMSANYMKTYQVPGANAGTTIIGRSLEQRPYDRIYKPDGSYYIGGTDGLTFHNPIQVLNEQNAYIENMRFLGNAHMNLKFLDNRISFKNTINTDITQLYDYTFYNSKHPYGKGVGEIIDKHETMLELSGMYREKQ